nr:nitroreductase family protein [Ardenticatena sp.]
MTTTRTQHVHELIMNRRSRRAYAPNRLIDRATIETLLQAAHLAPSSFNAQPWRFIVASKENPDAWQRVFETLMEGNQTWAQHAPLFIVAVAAVKPEGAERENGSALFDLGMAVQNLLLQAEALGLAARPMGGFSRDRLREAFDIPEGYHPHVVVALGYPGDPAPLPEPLRTHETAPRQRKPLSDVAFDGAWGTPWHT